MCYFYNKENNDWHTSFQKVLNSALKPSVPVDVSFFIFLELLKALHRLFCLLIIHPYYFHASFQRFYQSFFFILKSFNLLFLLINKFNVLKYLLLIWDCNSTLIRNFGCFFCLISFFECKEIYVGFLPSSIHLSRVLTNQPLMHFFVIDSHFARKLFFFIIIYIFITAYKINTPL